MKLIDVQEVVEHAEVNGESREFIRKMLDYLEDAPVIQTKLIKYFDEDEQFWTVRPVILGGPFDKDVDVPGKSVQLGLDSFD